MGLGYHRKMIVNSRQSSKADILIVDDIPDNLRLLSAMLTEQGYDVRSVTNGATALMGVKFQMPDLIILDIQMPGMNGYEVCEQLKINPATQAIPVIFISGLKEVFDKVKAFAVGGVDYITKPFEVSQAIPMLETAWHRFQTSQGFRKEVFDLKESLETRKLLDRAKGILMEQQGFSEELAHKTLQKMSQDQAISLQEVCRSLIQVRNLLGKTVLRKAV